MQSQPSNVCCVALASAMLCAACGVEPGHVEDDIAIAREALSVDPFCTEANIRNAAPVSAAPFLDRAFIWVHNNVMYCQCPTKGSGNHRADCSGFVSYVWNLSTPDNVTRQFPGGDRDNGKAVEIRWDELTVGDALNWNKNSDTDPAGHVMLFGGWADSSHVKFCTIEEYGTGHPASILTHSVSDPAAWWGGPKQPLKNVFHAIRKAGYTPSVATPAPSPSPAPAPAPPPPAPAPPPPAPAPPPPAPAPPPPAPAPPPPPPMTRWYVDTFDTALGYSSPGTNRTGSLWAGTNYVFCKVAGPRVQVGSAYNTWWLKTDLDEGSPWQGQYVSAYYLTHWGNDIAKDNNGTTIPNCN